MSAFILVFFFVRSVLECFSPPGGRAGAISFLFSRLRSSSAGHFERPKAGLFPFLAPRLRFAIHRWPLVDVARRFRHCARNIYSGFLFSSFLSSPSPHLPSVFLLFSFCFLYFLYLQAPDLKLARLPSLQAALTAIAALALFSDDIRRAVTGDLLLLPLAQAALGHRRAGTRYAARQ